MLVKIGKGLECDVNLARLGVQGSNPVLDHVLYIGLRNILMDAHASHTTESSADYLNLSLAAAQNKLEAMYRGEVRVSTERETDPVARQMRVLANGHAVKSIKERCRVNGTKFRDVKSEEITAETNKLLANNDAAFRKVAEKMVRDAASLKIEIR